MNKRPDSWEDPPEDDEDITEPTEYGTEWDTPDNAPYKEPTSADLNKDCDYWERLQ